MSRRTALMLFLMLAALMVTGSGRQKSSIFDTKHNLSVTGKGDIRSLTETRVCIFCHSSHNASPEGPLWNHETTVSGRFRTYERSSLSATSEQPSGATKLCLSCHDGTIAVGALINSRRDVPMTGVGSRGEIPSDRPSHLGTDLSGTHPVSIKYRQNLALSSRNLRWPPLDPENVVGTDAEGYVQCTACHDPHGSRSERLPFWPKTTFSAVCQVCHVY